MTDEDRAFGIIDDCMAGTWSGSINGMELGEYDGGVHKALQTYEVGGKEALLKQWESIVKSYPELAGYEGYMPPEVTDPVRQSGIPAEPEAPPPAQDSVEVTDPEIPEQFYEQEPDAWQILTLEDAYKPREPNEYAIQGLIKARSLSIVYGPPGTLKSLLLVDATICVAAGKPWLSPIPGKGGEDGRPTKQSSVLWCDFDNGGDIMHERIEAVSRAHGLAKDCPFNYVIMPQGWLDASDYNTPSMAELRVAVQKTEASVLVIDCLSLVSGNVDENSAEMAQVMSTFRQLAERANIAVILIHHQRKTVGIKGRAGDTLRGHSSIEAALDLALLIEREEESETVTLKATKVRGAIIVPFGAMFAYEHKPGTEKELHTARFFGVETEDLTSERAIRKAILESVQETAPIKKGDLTNAVKANLPDVGLNRIRNAIDWLANSGKLAVETGAHGALTYNVAGVK